MKTKAAFLLLILLCLFPVLWTECGAEDAEEIPSFPQYRKLTKNASGYDVYLLKIRMYQLGYLSSDQATDQYTALFKSKIKELQIANGLEPTGVATPELQALIFSTACVPADVTPAPTAVPTPSPVPTMPVSRPELPALDEEGFLPKESEEEFVYENQEDGLWYYISNSLYVEIRRFTQTGRNNLQWFETVVNLRDDLPRSYSVPTGETIVSPIDIARDNHLVLGISDDTYNWRIFHERRTGIVIRDGELISDTPHRKKNKCRFPNLDVMAFLPDGTMAVYENRETTPEELFALGVRDAYSFGPILLRDGLEPITVRYADNECSEKHPRCAVGMRSPNHFVVLTVVGRASFSDGCPLSWLADRMWDLGAVNAFNLDGGSSTSLVFMGKLLNKNGDNLKREISGLIGFGTSDLVSAEN